MPYTTVVAGTTITASWANTNVRDQVVSTFADAAARSSAIGSPAEGMISFLTGSNRADVYNSAGWSSLVNPAHGALINWTPEVQQDSAFLSRTVNRAVYGRVGRWVYGYLFITMSGSGSAGLHVNLTVPVTILAGGYHIGYGRLEDVSAPAGHSFFAQGRSGGTTFDLRAVASTAADNRLGMGTSPFTAALATGDTISVSFGYDASSDA
jgi:hypothetical protein